MIPIRARGLDAAHTREGGDSLVVVARGDGDDIHSRRGHLRFNGRARAIAERLVTVRMVRGLGLGQPAVDVEFFRIEIGRAHV